MFIYNAQVTFTDCNIYQNTAGLVSALAPFGSSNAPMDAIQLTPLLVAREVESTSQDLP